MDRLVSKKPILGNKSIFEGAGILRTLDKDMTATKLPHLSKHYKKKRVRWVKKYMKTDISTVI